MNFNHILCPVDFTDISRKNLRRAIELARQFEARLTVIHVVSKAPWMVPPIPTVPVSMDQYQQELIASSRSALEELIATEVPDDLQAEMLLETGDPSQAIARVAEENAADLIVIASREDSALNRFIFGSVAEKVIRSASCPVLVLKEE